MEKEKPTNVKIQDLEIQNAKQEQNWKMEIEEQKKFM